MAYTLSNKCAKNLCKRTVLLQLIIKNVVTCFFLEHSVLLAGHKNPVTLRAEQDARATVQLLLQLLLLMVKSLLHGHIHG